MTNVSSAIVGGTHLYDIFIKPMNMITFPGVIAGGTHLLICWSGCSAVKNSCALHWNSCLRCTWAVRGFVIS